MKNQGSLTRLLGSAARQTGVGRVNVGARSLAPAPRKRFTEILATTLSRGRSYEAIGGAQSGSRSASVLGAIGRGTSTDQLRTGWTADPLDLPLALGMAALHRGGRSSLAATTPAERRGAAGAGWAQRLVAVPNGYGSLVAEAAQTYRLDPALLVAVIQVESGFNPDAVSSAGAKGLMQLMDGTARGLGVSNAFDPRENVFGGARLLRQLLDRHGGDVRLALAAYNAGSGAVERYGGIPPYPETQRYVPKVLESAARFGQLSSPTVSAGS